MFESTLKKITVLAALIWRLGILAAIILLNHTGGFSKPECWKLISMVLPVSCLFITTSLVFIGRNMYVIRSKKINLNDALWGIFIHAIYLVQLAAMLFKAFWGLPAETLYNILLITECLCAVYGALYLHVLYPASKPGAGE